MSEDRIPSHQGVRHARYVSKTQTPRRSGSESRTRVYIKHSCQEKHALLLDLDETLIKAFYDPPARLPSKAYVKVFDPESMYPFYVLPRPGLDAFLRELSQYFNIYIYTSSVLSYARTICSGVGIMKYITNIYHRKHCKEIAENMFVKNIFKLGFAEESSVLIDDLPRNLECQPSNSILIKEFNGNMGDTELLRLIPFLVLVSQLPDVRPVSKAMDLYFAESEIREKIFQSVRKSSENFQADEGEPLSEVLKRSTTNPTNRLEKKSFSFKGSMSAGCQKCPIDSPQTSRFEILDCCLQTDGFKRCDYFSIATLVFEKAASEGSLTQPLRRPSAKTSLDFSTALRANNGLD